MLVSQDSHTISDILYDGYEAVAVKVPVSLFDDAAEGYYLNRNLLIGTFSTNTNLYPLIAIRPSNV